MRLGDYRLEQRIGSGASGTVWKASRQGPLAQAVALKRLVGGPRQPDDLARLRREAAILSELDHPHIVRVLDVLDGEDGVAICMQFAPGGSLAALLAERGRLAPGQAVAVVAPIADALGSAHRRAVVHGDVKPANILFTSDGEPLLSDFGVARLPGPVPAEHLAGTLEYLAPELIAGAAPDPRSDVYALGIVAYEALVGAPPYMGDDPDAVVHAIRTGAHPPLGQHSDVPQPLSAAIEHAMARDSDRRFASATAFAQALRESVRPEQIRLPGTARTPQVDEAATRPTQTFGPRPPRPEPAPVRRRRLRLPRLGSRGGRLILIGLAIAGLGYLAQRTLLGDGDGESAGADGDASCPNAQSPEVGPHGEVVSGDPDGAGCEITGVYDLRTLSDGAEQMVLTIEVDGEQRRLGLGEPGDRVFLGDWNCDGRDTPGLYRHDQGEVQYFHVWPDSEEQRPDDIEAVPAGGEAVLEASPAVEAVEPACDRIVVTESVRGVEAPQ